jgi:hypothetical protein
MSYIWLKLSLYTTFKIKDLIKICQYNNNQSPAHERRANFGYIIYIKYTPDNGQCLSQTLENDKINFAEDIQWIKLMSKAL